MIRNGKLHRGVAFAICTNPFHLPKNGRYGLKLVSKMALKKWNTDFRLGNSVHKTGLPFQLFRCFGRFSAGTTQKVVYHDLILSKWIFRKLFQNDKQLLSRSFTWQHPLSV